MADERDIAEAIVALLGRRAPQASICPSEVARKVGGASWRAHMPQVRRIAADLAESGRIRATHGDAALPTDGIAEAKGPIRLRRGPRFDVGWRPGLRADARRPGTPRSP